MNTALVRWLKKLLGVEVILEHQSGPTPALPYVTVNLIQASEVRSHHSNMLYDEETDGDIEATPVVEMEWFYSVSSYGPNPVDILRPIVSASKLSQVMEPMFPNLVISELSAIRNIPSYINEAWEPRAQIDMFLRGVIKDGHVIDVIEEYEVDLIKT